jgi:HTH-type transcriptional regulator/antitoxin HipB
MCRSGGRPHQSATLSGMASFELPGALRRVRRLADLSQRELARAIETSKSAIAAVEAGHAGFDARLLARAAALAGLRLALVDGDGREVAGMSSEAVRDQAGRFYPAHLDTRYGDDRWWYAVHRYDRPQPWYTFDRDRSARDSDRRHSGTPDDHQLPQPGDSPAERAEARRLAAARRRHEARERAQARMLSLPVEDPWTCECPPRCQELDDHSGPPVHAADCPCRCDVG